jgi:hypothetical protein
MRQGWAYLEDPADGSPLVAPGLLELIPSLQSGRFTSLDAAGGRRLAQLFGLAGSPPS